MSESNDRQDREAFIAEIRRIGDLIFTAINKRQESTGTYVTPAVRISSDRMRELIDDSIAKIDVAIAAATQRERDRETRMDVDGMGLVGAPHAYLPGFGHEAEILGQQRELLSFTREYLVPDAVFEMDARNAFSFLCSDGRGRSLAMALPCSPESPIRH